ncbi:hypothetical protein BJY01DRAFT_242374 [Aspergillus pseudoustus]|uniref:Fungal N-terminal domain-containing protein n=1 Tax=Aspergillus pseudoustus TaxID=1810923 RepID=A0ABR4KYE2_9EURO
MEGLAAAATIIRVAGAGLALAQTLYNFCDEVSTSNEQLTDLAFYVCSASFVLEEIGKVFQDEGKAAKPVASQNAIDTASEIAQRIIKSRIYTTLYSYGGLQKNDAEVIRAIRELDDELESWRLTMPVGLRPTLSYGREPNNHPNTMSMYLILCHLNYYFCVNVVHIAGSRCEAWHSASTSPGMMGGLKSSLTLSVEASRSLLLYLQGAENSDSVVLPNVGNLDPVLQPAGTPNCRNCGR